MSLVFINNAETSLASGINDSATTLAVADGSVFGSLSSGDYFFATIDDDTNVEVVLVTAISSNNLTVTRAQDGSSATAFSAGAKFEARINKKILDSGSTRITDLDNDTKIQVEETADEDIIRFDIAGTEKMVLDNNGDLNLSGKVKGDTVSGHSSETSIASDDEIAVYDVSASAIKKATIANAALALSLIHI